jgi:ABC-type Zn2+ transport system substrate-binding protein/surface adhesin
VQLQGFDIVAIRGFVEELLVEHDPEYIHTCTHMQTHAYTHTHTNTHTHTHTHRHTHTHKHTHTHTYTPTRRYHWSERFRASRTSNEARQILFNQLTNKIRRSVGSKAVAMGANAVVTF